MLTVIIGGSGSGKSEFAEAYVQGLGEAVNYYVATMHPFGEEGKARIERHRRLREGKPFLTVECFRDAGELDFDRKGAVLLECLSNLAANEMFDTGKKRAPGWYAEKLQRDMERLEKSCSHLVIVTNEIFSDGRVYDAETTEYIEVLGMVNRKLCARAGEVIEVVAGLPDYHKRRRT